MKNNFTITGIFILILIALNHQASGWGVDRVISPFAPSSQHSLAAKSNGLLFAATAGIGVNGVNVLTVFTSTNNGNSWSIAPLSGLPTVTPVLKTKMVVTALDSVYCLFMQLNQLYILNVESGIMGQFNSTGIEDFDAVTSANGNWIYLFIDEPGNNNIMRYGTVDGGFTYTGTTSIVTSNGARPKLCRYGNRYILNFYGTPQADISTSIIRAAVYTESTPGTINAGTFQDVAPNNGSKRKQFQTILNNGVAWFIFTEGDTQQVIRCKNSVDNGVTYPPSFIIAGDASVNAFWFGASGYETPSGNGVTLTYLADSLSPGGNSFDKMLLLGSTFTASNVFTTLPAPNNTFNDTTVISTAVNVLPMLIHYSSGGGSNTEIGISWMGESIQGPWYYFDALSFTVGLNETNTPDYSVNTFPSPASEFINVEISGITEKSITLEIINIEGRLLMSQSLDRDLSSSSPLIPVNISTLPSGNYMIRIVSGNHTQQRRFMVKR